MHHGPCLYGLGLLIYAFLPYTLREWSCLEHEYSVYWKEKKGHHRVADVIYNNRLHVLTLVHGRNKEKKRRLQRDYISFNMIRNRPHLPRE
jgi:hypothetical protein